MYCNNCGKEVKDTDSYCSSCGSLLHATTLAKKELKSNPFLVVVIVSNIMVVLSAMMPILHVYNDYNNQYINIGLWRYLDNFENLFNTSNYQGFFRIIVENGVSRYSKELICTVFGSIFLIIGILIYFLSVICALYFLYHVLQGIRGKRLANLSSRTMISGIAFFFCILIYSFIPYSSYMNDGRKPNISVIGFVILITFLVNVFYIEKEYLKRECINGKNQKNDNEKVGKAWGLSTLARMFVLTVLLGSGITTILTFIFKEGLPYSPLYGWAIEGEWISSGNDSRHYDDISVFIGNHLISVEIDGIQCMEDRTVKNANGVGVNYIFKYRDYPFYLNITRDEIYVEGAYDLLQYHDTLKRAFR